MCQKFLNTLKRYISRIAFAQRIIGNESNTDNKPISDVQPLQATGCSRPKNSQTIYDVSTPLLSNSRRRNRNIVIYNADGDKFIVFTILSKLYYNIIPDALIKNHKYHKNRTLIQVTSISSTHSQAFLKTFSFYFYRRIITFKLK